MLSALTVFTLGFCRNGPFCKFRHLKRPPDECPAIANFDACLENNTSNSNNSYLAQNINNFSLNLSSMMNFNKRRNIGSGGSSILPSFSTGQPEILYKVSICRSWLESEEDSCPLQSSCNFAHGEGELNVVGDLEEYNDETIYDPTRGQMTKLPSPLPFLSSGEKLTYFVLQAPDIRSLVVSRRRSVWLASTKIVNEMNFAVSNNKERVILIFSVRPMKGIYGLATFTSVIPIPAETVQNSIEFEITWLRSFRLSLKVVTLTRAGTGGRSSLDIRLDKAAGSEIFYLAYRKPEWDWEADRDKILNFTAPSNAALPADVLFLEDFLLANKEEVSPSPVSSLPIPPPPRPYRAPPTLLESSSRKVLPFLPPVLSVPPQDYYPGDIPGFIFTAKTYMIPEIFGRFIFALPPQLLVRPCGISFNFPLLKLVLDI